MSQLQVPSQRRLNRLLAHFQPVADGFDRTDAARYPDGEGLLEYSVVYTDRALNHMSPKFQGVMNYISRTLKSVHHAAAVAIVPGGGTYAMEAVARQFASGQRALVLRNGYFSFRWSQIFEACAIPALETVLCAAPVEGGSNPQYAPAPIAEVVATIRRDRPAVVFAPHVETASGMMLPGEYMKAVADAVHEVDGLFVLDCIASGTVWVDMEATGVDVLISAPQKAWSGPACAGLVMMSERARARVDETESTSFACSLKKWVAVMDAYEGGGHMYHATMPTDALTRFRDVMMETEQYGFDKVKQEQLELGAAVRDCLRKRGIKSVAADAFAAPGVVVSYTSDPDMKNGAKFSALGMQIAVGLPLMCDAFTKSKEFSTFRLGLFGLDKIQNIDRTVRLLEQCLDAMMPIADVRTSGAQGAGAGSLL